MNIVGEPRKVSGDALERLIGSQVDGFDLEWLHEALSFGVVVKLPRRLTEPARP